MAKKKGKLIPVTTMITPGTKAELAAMAAERPRASVSYLIDVAIQQFLRAEKKAQPAHEDQIMVGA